MINFCASANNTNELLRPSRYLASPLMELVQVEASAKCMSVNALYDNKGISVTELLVYEKIVI